MAKDGIIRSNANTKAKIKKKLLLSLYKNIFMYSSKTKNCNYRYLKNQFTIAKFIAVIYDLRI